MLGGLLSKEECAACKLCCSFDSYDLLSTPVITAELKSRICERFKPEQRFIENDGHFLLRMEREKDADIYYCSLLDHERGCIMGDEKPLDCRIWPLRVMRLGEVSVIALSPLCPVVAKKPIAEIMATCARISAEIFRQAREHPEYVKPYEEGFPILALDM